MNRMGTAPLCGRDKSDEDCLRPIFLCQGLVLGGVPVVAICRHVPVHEPFPIALEGGKSAWHLWVWRGGFVMVDPAVRRWCRLQGG